MAAEGKTASNPMLRKFIPYVAIPVLFAVLLALVFGHVISKGPANLAGLYDVYRYYAPQTFLIDYSIHHGDFPFWNPITFCGMPFAANPQTSALYPLNLLRGLLQFHPTPQGSQVSYILLLALHIIMAGSATYALGRAHGLRQGGALAAGIAFAFSSLMVRRAAEFHFIPTLAWLPVLLLAVKYTLDQTEWRARLRYASLGACAFALCVLGGFAHIVPHMAVTTGLYGLFYRYLQWNDETAVCAGKPAQLWKIDATSVAIFFGLGGALAAILILPLLEMKPYTAREKGDEVSQYSNPLGQMPEKTAQDFLLYPGVTYEAEAIRGSGIAALLLAGLSFTYRRRRVTWLFFLLYYVLLDCALGPPFPVAFVFGKIAPFAMSASSRAYDLALLPLSMLAGIGVDAISERMPSAGANNRRTIGIAVCGAALLLCLAYWLNNNALKHCQDVTHTKLVLYIPLAALALMVASSRLELPRAAQIGLPVLIFAEILAWDVHFVPSMLRQTALFPEAPATGEYAIPQGNARATDPMQCNSLFGLKFIYNGYDPLHIARVRSVISGVGRGKSYFRAVRNWECTEDTQRGNLLAKRAFWLSRQWAKGPLPAKEDLFPSATTVFFEEPGAYNVPQATQLPHSGVSENVQSQELNAGFLGKAIAAAGKRTMAVNYQLPVQAGSRPEGPSGCVHSVIRVSYQSNCPVLLRTAFVDKASKRAELGRRFELPPTRNQERTVEFAAPDIPRGLLQLTIEGNTPQGQFVFSRVQALSDLNDEDGLLRVVRRTLNTVEVEVRDLEAPRILTYLDADYPGWKAYVDGQPAPIYLADEAFKAVALPAGTHTVRFVFYPYAFYKGCVVSIAGLVALIALWFFTRSPKAAPAAAEEKPRKERKKGKAAA